MENNGVAKPGEISRTDSPPFMKYIERFVAAVTFSGVTTYQASLF